MKTRPITKKSPYLKTIKNLYTRAFPPAEMTPFFLLLRRTKKKNVDFLAFFDNEIVVGFVYLITQRDLTLISYLAVADTLHSQGYGSQILAYVEEIYPQQRIILSIEQVPSDAAPDDLRLRRKRFYQKNGYQAAGFYVKEYGVDYELLVKNGSCSPAEYLELMKKYIGPFLRPIYKVPLVTLK